MRQLSLALAVMCAFVMSVGAEDKKPAAVGDAAPAFSLTDQNGKTVTLADQKGKIVVLEWFNEDCPIVQRVYKSNIMQDTAKKWTEKGVVWLAVNTTKDKTNATNK